MSFLCVSKPFFTFKQSGINHPDEKHILTYPTEGNLALKMDKRSERPALFCPIMIKTVNEIITASIQTYKTKLPPSD